MASSSTKKTQKKKTVVDKKDNSKTKEKKVNDVKLENKKVSKVKKTKDVKKVSSGKEKKENTSKAKDCLWKKKIINKTSITYLGLIIFDVLLTIYMARQNVINYVIIVDKKIMMSKLSYLLLGRNYVNIVLMIFFYGYTCLINKFFLKRKNSIKFLILLLITVVALNLLLFYLFSNKVY